jgi:Glycosyl hydrolase family 92
MLVSKWSDMLTVSSLLSSTFLPSVLCPCFEEDYTLNTPHAGDEDNGEQGAWFVLSALGLFSTVPGSPLLVLGSPIFRHVRIWRGKCDAGGVECDYRDNSSEDTDAVDKNQIEGNTPHTFPPDSSYLDVVALGTSLSVCKVAEITFNGAGLPPSDSRSSSLRKDSGADHRLANAEFFSSQRRLAKQFDSVNLLS